ncbi:hypothetical protein BDZ89DRAFT_222949 [Hymenopellis radicata]|nr:hypothetical protein BDZ89DRAFT_222949 [Hymenopellis radicata]
MMQAHTHDNHVRYRPPQASSKRPTTVLARDNASSRKHGNSGGTSREHRPARAAFYSVFYALDAKAPVFGGKCRSIDGGDDDGGGRLQRGPRSARAAAGYTSNPSSLVPDTASTSRRVTRSQTGPPAKRRVIDDDDDDQSPPPAKKPRVQRRRSGKAQTAPYPPRKSAPLPLSCPPYHPR